MKFANDSPARSLFQLSAVAMIGALGCGQAESPAAPVDEGTSLAHEVFPIIQEAGCNSLGCHDDPTRGQTHYTDLRTPESVYSTWVGEPGGMLGFNHCDPSGSPKGLNPPNLDTRRVVPGEPDASLVIQKLEEKREVCDPFYGRMPPPPRERMAPEHIAVIRQWITEGARNN